MENIKFILKIAMEIPNQRKHKVIGNSIYYILKNGNRVKAYCEKDGVKLEVINLKEGKVDSAQLPFRNYFQPVQCSQGAPLWYQHIDNDKWYFEETYEHVLPKLRDYQNLAEAMEDYMCMFE